MKFVMRAREIACRCSGDSLFRRAVMTFDAKLNDLSDEADVAGMQHVPMNTLNSDGYIFR